MLVLDGSDVLRRQAIELTNHWAEKNGYFEALLISFRPMALI